MHLPGVLYVPVGNGDELHLHRGQSHRKRAAIVLNQHAEKTLHRAEQRAVNHVGLVLLAVFADIGQVEALWQVKVKLDRVSPQ